MIKQPKAIRHQPSGEVASESQESSVRRPESGKMERWMGDLGVHQYWHLARVAFRRALAYRAATWAGLATNLFFGFLRSYFYMAVLSASGGSLGGYDRQQMLGLTAWGQTLLVFLSIFGWWELHNQIQSGEVVGDLWRPADIYWVWQAKDLGRSLHAILFRGLPLVISYSLILTIPFPNSPLVWVSFIISLIMAAMISFAYRFAANCIAFWTLEARGLLYIAWATSGFLSGFNIPVAAFPRWLQTIAHLTPFPSMFDTPLQIVLGRSSLSAIPQLLAVQMLWVVISMVLARFVVKLGVKRMVIQGG